MFERRHKIFCVINLPYIRQNILCDQLHKKYFVFERRHTKYFVLLICLILGEIFCVITYTKNILCLRGDSVLLRVHTQFTRSGAVKGVIEFRPKPTSKCRPTYHQPTIPQGSWTLHNIKLPVRYRTGPRIHWSTKIIQ